MSVPPLWFDVGLLWAKLLLKHYTLSHQYISLVKRAVNAHSSLNLINPKILDCIYDSSALHILKARIATWRKENIMFDIGKAQRVLGD